MVAALGKEESVPNDTAVDEDRVDQIASMSRSVKPNYRRFSKCQHYGMYRAITRCATYEISCFKCGKLSHWVDCCGKPRKGENSLLATVNSTSLLALSMINVEKKV